MVDERLTAIGLPLESHGHRCAVAGPARPVSHRRGAQRLRPAGGPARAGEDRRGSRRSGQERNLFSRAFDHGPDRDGDARPARQPRQPGARARDGHALDGFRWLDQATGWFRLLPVERHGLPKAIDKVLSVAGSVTAAELHKALSRNRRLWKEPPPEKVLLEFCRHMPGIRIEGQRIISTCPRDWRKSLTGVEAKLVSILKEHGPVMERGAMEDLCVAGGMNRFSFHAFVSWSPVIASWAQRLRAFGADVSPGQVEELLVKRRANRANRRVLDRHGVTEDGKVWLRYRLSKAASTYAVITVPAALKRIVRGRFQFLTADGRAIGTLATKDGRAWGLGAFLRNRAPPSATTLSSPSTWRNAPPRSLGTNR